MLDYIIYIRCMGLVRIILLPLLCCSCLLCFSQGDSVLIKVTVTDAYTQKPLAGVSIINPKTGQNIVTDGKGRVDVKADKSEALFVFYPGYRTLKFSVADSVLKSEYAMQFVLDPFSMGLNHDVIIKAPKTLEDIEEDRKKLGITPKELEKPDVPFTSVISALYELLSARAKEREKLKKQMTEDDRRKVFKELLNYYNEKELIDLPEDRYDEFIDFCDLSLDFLKYYSDYEIMKTVTGLYKKYARGSGLEK